MLKKILRIPIKDQIEVVKIVVLSGYYRFVILTMPYKFLERQFGSHNTKSIEGCDINAELYQKKVYIEKVSKHTPWESLCLVQALVFRTYLKKNKISHTLYLGLRKDNKNLVAHAWITSGNKILMGEREESFKVINYYSTNY